MQLIKQVILKHLEYHDEDKLNKRDTISHLAEAYCLSLPFVEYNKEEIYEINTLFEDFLEDRQKFILTNIENMMRPRINDFLHKFENIKIEETIKINFKDDVIGFLKEELGGI